MDRQRKKSPKKWKYIPLKDRAVSAMSAAVSATTLIGSLALGISPLGAVVGTAYVAAKAIPGLRTKTRKRGIERAIKSGKLIPVAAECSISKMATEISNQMGRSVPPRVYTMKGNKDADYFASAPSTNVLITSQTTLDNSSLTEAEMRFIVAHEIAHLQTDSKSITKHVGLNTLVIAAGMAGAVSLGASLGLGLTGAFFLPATGILGSVALFGLVLTHLAVQFSSRVCERRADRNALYVTRDLENAKSSLKKVYEALYKGKKQPSILVEPVQSHPSCGLRLKKLSKAFKKVSAYPPLQALAQPVSPVAQPLQKQNGLSA